MLSAPLTLDHDAIARRVPHQHRMCLLDAVIAWDNNSIACETHSHTAGDHPLRAHGRLGAACGIEYAAQAMAVHGALVAEQLAAHDSVAAAPRSGYLASVRSVDLHVDRLDTFAEPLSVTAERITGDDNTVLYSFAVSAGEKVLLNGRAVVVLDAAALAQVAVQPTRDTP